MTGGFKNLCYLGEVEGVEVPLLGLLEGHDLDVHGPGGVVPGGDGVVQVADGVVGVLLGHLQYSTVQYSSVQYSIVQYSTVQHSTIQHSTACHLVGLLAGEGAMALVRLVVELAVHRLAGTVHHLERVGPVSKQKGL